MSGPQSRVAGVVLAAGRSDRFGPGRPKQLAEIGGEPMVRRVCRVALAARLAEVVVVTGYEAARVGRAVAGLKVRLADNPRWAAGQSTSVRAGLAALATGAEGALFIACDQPLLTAAVLDRLVDAFEATGGPIVVPTAGGERAAPVLFGRALFGELAAIRGDRGGRQLFASHAGDIVEVAIPEPRLLADVDTPEALAEADGTARP